MTDLKRYTPKEIKSHEPKNPKSWNCQCILSAEPANSKIEQILQKLKNVLNPKIP